jgi:hypothetical protein
MGKPKLILMDEPTTYLFFKYTERERERERGRGRGREERGERGERERRIKHFELESGLDPSSRRALWDIIVKTKVFISLFLYLLQFFLLLLLLIIVKLELGISNFIVLF